MRVIEKKEKPFTAEARDKILQKICDLIRKKKSFFLSGHQRPDGDTVASELALGMLLRRLGKKVEIYNFEPVPKNLLFLPGAKSIRVAWRVSKKYDAAFIFECFDAARMGNIIDLKKQAGTVVNIDHHLKHSFFGDINLINPRASSNSEQLYYLYEKLKLRPTKQEASCLYVGIMTDTGRFQYPNTTPETLRIASELLKEGVEVHLLCERIYGRRSVPALKLLAAALSKLKLFFNGKVAYAELSKKDFESAKAGEDETEEIVNYGLMIPGTLISILARESDANGMVKVSLRSRKEIDVCKIAESFGGGGHKNASGCKIGAPISKVSSLLLSRVRKFISQN